MVNSKTGPKPDGDSKPKYTPKSEVDSKYFGKGGDQAEISNICVMCKKEHMLWAMSRV